MVTIRNIIFLLLIMLSIEGGAASQVPLQHFPYGPVQKPIVVPDIVLTMQNGTKANLRTLLKGKVTAIQLIFTGCSATCPIQGALFAVVAKQVNNVDIQLLSISIDPLNDNALALQRWMSRYEPHKFWSAGVPNLTDSEILFDYLNGKSDSVDNHTAQVYLFNRSAELVFKSDEIPSAKMVVNVLNKIEQIPH